MGYDFRWNNWNRDKVAKHGVLPEEAEYVVDSARKPFPRKIGDERRLVCGPTAAGRLLQVIFLFDEDDTVFVIHARPLTETEKRRLRRRRK